MRERKEGGNGEAGMVSCDCKIAHCHEQPTYLFAASVLDLPCYQPAHHHPSHTLYTPSQRLANASLYPKVRSEAIAPPSRHARQAANLSMLSTFQKGTPAPMIGDDSLADQLHLPLKGAHRGGMRPSHPARAKDHHVQARQAECARGVRSR